MALGEDSKKKLDWSIAYLFGVTTIAVLTCVVLPLVVLCVVLTWLGKRYPPVAKKPPPMPPADGKGQTVTVDQKKPEGATFKKADTVVVVEQQTAEPPAMTTSTAYEPTATIDAPYPTQEPLAPSSH